ncbi:MAG: NUDIX domain-containing protein [Nanoarchaeota archaeon]
MAYSYKWDNKEANFGPPTSKQIDGGMHIAFEIILKKDGEYVALRRPEAIPGHEHPLKKTKNGLLYFCHDLIKYGETIESCIKRIVKEQTGVSVKNMKVVYIDSLVQNKDNQWAFTPHVIAELDKIPSSGKHGNEITKVVIFNKSNIPDDFGWWTKKELKEFIEEFD